MRAAAADMLEASGVPELEQAVLGFLFEAAAGVKLVAVLDDMGRLLTEVSSLSMCQGSTFWLGFCLRLWEQHRKIGLDL